MSTRRIGKECNLSGKTVNYWVHKYNLQDRSKFTKNEPYAFGKIDTKEKAYTLGFILADGSISPKGVLQLGVSLYDKTIIEFISKVIGGNVRYDHTLIQEKRRFPNAELSRKVTDILKFTGGRLKVDRHYPRVPDNLERYLIQGLFDADGYITWGRRKDKNRIWQKISFTSQLKILEGVQKYLLNKLDISTAIKPKTGCDCYAMDFANKKDVLKFCEHIYPDESFIILNRKYLKYKALRLELEENGETNRSDCQYRAEPTE